MHYAYFKVFLVAGGAQASGVTNDRVLGGIIVIFADAKEENISDQRGGMLLVGGLIRRNLHDVDRRLNQPHRLRDQL
jgi:hypothetical protein